MQNKGAIRLLVILLSLVCLFYLSFTWVTVSVEEDAKEYAQNFAARTDVVEKATQYANGDTAKKSFYLDSVYDSRLTRYLDSMKGQDVYLGFTYLDCKKKEINLGLDLKGGMNVTLEINVADIIKAMSSRPDDPILNKAIDAAKEKEKDDDRDFVTLFGESLKELDKTNNISFYFRSIDLKGQVDADTKDEDVLALIREQVTRSISTAENTLRARIDRFGVTQPNIQPLETSGRILIELPGITEKERVRELLQGSANLEFWETFDNKGEENKQNGIFFRLVDANAKLKTILYPEMVKDSLAQDSLKKASADTSKTKVTASNLPPDTLKKKDSTSLSSLLSGDTVKGDTITAGVDSAEIYRKENPLFSILLYALNETKDQPAEGPVIGFAMTKDTAQIMKYLTHEKVINIFPAGIKFLWGKPSSDDQSGVLSLYAIKVTDRNGKAALYGDIISSAKVEYDQSGGGNASVAMTMKEDAAVTWATLTKANKDKSIAIVLDNLVYSAPNVIDEITGGRSSITGRFTPDQADDLANVLSAGKLPAKATIVEETVVGPTLGKESIRAGFTSFVIALAIVFLFMAFYYNRAGLVADIVLFANMFFIMGVLASYGAVLTLPGIAGIVLVIGLSVDANILIFERIREEIAGGKGQALAIRDGFKGAMSSILDSNITTLILGIILAAYGTGPVQGFAVTLIIGILSSLFCAIFISRLIFEAMLKRDVEITFSNAISRGAFKNVNINFVGRRKLYYLISTLIIVAGVFFYFQKGGFHLGVDFKGGRSYVVEFDKPVTPTEVQSALTKAFEGDRPEVKTYGGESENKLKITTTHLIDNNAQGTDSIVEQKLTNGIRTIVADFDPKESIISQVKVGETISRDIRNASFLTVIFSCVVMFIYILIRFKKWQYGLGATVALFHDVAIVLSFYLIFDGVLPFALEIDQHFIAAILTVMGYSMTDTVVVFDRIREFLSAGNKKDVAGEERRNLINYALNATLSRTMITSLTTFFVLLAIFIFGGEVIRGFAFALLIGIIIGTYSSLCIASPVVIDLDRKKA